MSETLRLLKYDPAVALLIMVNNHLNLHLRPEFAKVTDPTAIEGTLTEVKVTTFDSINDFISRRYTGELTYRYDRIHVASLFSDMVLTVTPPTTVLGVMTNLAQASGLVITNDDFENQRVESNSFLLTAKPNSLRWVGSVTVMLNEPGTAIQLADAFPNNILNGLTPPDFSGGVDLQYAIPDPLMNGLAYSTLNSV